MIHLLFEINIHQSLTFNLYGWSITVRSYYRIKEKLLWWCDTLGGFIYGFIVKNQIKLISSKS